MNIIDEVMQEAVRVLKEDIKARNIFGVGNQLDFETLAYAQKKKEEVERRDFDVRGMPFSLNYFEMNGRHFYSVTHREYHEHLEAQNAN